MSDTKCILEDYRVDKCAGCTSLCPNRIALHGLDGTSGRVGGAGLPSNYRYVTLGNSPARIDQVRIYEMMDKYVDTFKRTTGERVKSFYLWSDEPGTGKTTLAAALLNSWIAVEFLTALKEGRQPPATNSVFLDVNSFQNDYNLAVMTNDDDGIVKVGKMIKKAQMADFAVIDDVGTRSSTEAFTSHVHTIINHRTANDLPTIFTSNLPMAEMINVFDKRIYDRMRDESVEVHFDGESKRGRR